MKILEVEGNRPLIGSVGIGGAKNSAVALIPAAILSNNKTENKVVINIIIGNSFFTVLFFTDNE